MAKTEVISAAAVTSRPELARQLRAGIEKACEILSSGNKPADCLVLLENAVESMRILGDGWDLEPRTLQAIRTSLKRAGSLVTGGTTFFDGWLRIVSMQGGYTAQGDLAALTAKGQVSFHG